MEIFAEDCCYSCGKTINIDRRDDEPIGILRYDTGDDRVGLEPLHFWECIECFNKEKSKGDCQ